MDLLIGSTGFVGGHLARAHAFDLRLHRPDIERATGADCDLLVCAGLPAEKWKANANPAEDWANMAALAQVVASTSARRAVLVSTVDVYQPAVGVDERSMPAYDGPGAYGAHRAWFEAFFRNRFPDALIIRLPGLFAADVRKNLVHDLLHGKVEQWRNVNPLSTFQFFDATLTWSIIEQAWKQSITLLNVSSEPVTAQQVAGLYGIVLDGDGLAVAYDMRTIHDQLLGGSGGYLFTADECLAGIDALRG